MIYLQKDNINTVILTLTESSQLSNPEFLFVFINEFQTFPNQDEIFFTTSNDSSYTNRYDMFDIELSSSGSTTGGTSVALNLDGGQYRYEVYEATASTLSISATTGSIIESGRLVVEMSDDDKLNTQNIYN